MEIGDWMVFGGMGSYTYGPKSKFNGMETTEKIEVWRGEMIKDSAVREEFVPAPEY